MKHSNLSLTMVGIAISGQSSPSHPSRWATRQSATPTTAGPTTIAHARTSAIAISWPSVISPAPEHAAIALRQSCWTDIAWSAVPPRPVNRASGMGMAATVGTDTARTVRA